MIITFLFRIKYGEVRSYGKYIGGVSDDYEEGLDIELRNTLYPVLKKYYGLEQESDLQVGILSYYRDGSDYFSEEEKNVLDLLYCKWSNQPRELFICGKPVEIKN
jgi:hypothetical protein